jgi:PHD/YefM family antitoxin component YafN of YafNO toxin-antitoxin module
MINIRPVSDLRNKYPEIEKLVLKENEAVYLTKNGYGSMVVMSLEKYSQIVEELEIDEAIQEKFDGDNLEKILDEIDEEIKEKNTKYLTHEEVFSELKRRLNEK